MDKGVVLLLQRKMIVCAFLFLVIVAAAGALNQHMEKERMELYATPGDSSFQIFSSDQQINGLNGFPPFRPREYVRKIRELPL